MTSPLALPRTLRWILLSIALILFAVVLPSVKASKPSAPVADQQAEAAGWAAAPVAGATSPVNEFHQQTKATFELPSQAYRLAVNVAEIAYDLQPLAASRQRTLGPRQVGIGRDVGLLSATQGQRHENADGTTVRVLAIKSPGAQGLRVHIQDLDLPAGDQIFIYGKTAESRVEGPFRGKGPFKDGEFWSGTIEGDTAIIEHYMMGAEQPFRIGQVSHMVTMVTPNDITPNVLSCHQDAMCFNDPEKNSVARFTFIEGADSFVCTGSMLNDRAADFQPFFLTASHCISTQQTARTVELFWFYRTTSCNSGIVSGSSVPTLGGANLLVTNRSSDSTLLRLLGTVPGGVQFSGWDPGVKTTGTSAFSLSHPDGGTPPSLLSFLRRASGQITNTSTNCNDTGLLNGYFVNWSAGTTEGGSSGSGLWVTTGGQNYLIGVLSCGAAMPDCTSAKRFGLYGKFSDFYPLARPFIDPSTTTCNATAISIGQSVSGQLTASDCAGRKGFADRYTFNGVAGQQIAISLSSSAFDTYLYLVDPSGALFTEDDDGGEGTDSRIPTSGFFSLPATGTYTIEATSFTGTSTGSYNLSLTGTVPCSFSISPTSQSFNANGGSSSLSVTAPSGCAWTASSNASWLAITSGTSGSGNGTVFYSVQVNNGVPRTGTLTVAGQTFTVTEDGNQPQELSIDDGSFENAIGLVNGGTDYVVNRLTPPSYPARLSAVAIFWRNETTGVHPGDSFDVLVGTNPSGSTNINGRTFQTIAATVQTLGQFNVYGVPDVTINSGDFVIGFRITYARGVFPTADDQTLPLRRRSYLSTDGLNFTLVDDVATTLAGNFGIRARLIPVNNCTYSISPTSQFFGAGGGTGSVAITTSASCQWNATSNANWITITSSTSGTGNGSINYSVAANSGGARSGTLNISGQTLTVSQVNNGPVITSALVAGKQLLVTGQGFDNGAAIFMDGERQKKVFNDEGSPTTLLSARKSGKKIAHGQTVILQVINASGAASQLFSFTRP